MTIKDFSKLRRTEGKIKLKIRLVIFKWIYRLTKGIVKVLLSDGTGRVV